MRILGDGKLIIKMGIEKRNKKHTKISSTDHDYGLCYYFFIVEVRNKSEAAFFVT